MNKLKKLLRAKRAFSAVIASLILMLLAVAAGVVVYSYVMGWLGGATTTSGGTQGKLQFESIYANTTAGTIKIYVRNTGGKDLALSKIYVDGTEKANATAIAVAGVSITVQSAKYLQVSHTMTSGYFYEVKVTCKDGTTISQSTEGK
jgi:FlaG/FlaF family flagellin (archaellin)